MAKRPQKPSRAYFAPTQAAERRMQDALHRYDDVVSQYEMRWGVDRLPWLVGTELRERFEAQMQKLNKAIDDRHDVEHQVEVTLRGVAALEQAAIERGAQQLTGDYIETAMPDGRVLAITRTSWEVAKVKRENRDMVVYSAEEVAILIAGFEEKQKTLTTIKETFPGAVVESITPKAELELDDEIPF
jgi:hypothetical protein